MAAPTTTIAAYQTAVETLYRQRLGVRFATYGWREPKTAQGSTDSFRSPALLFGLLGLLPETDLTRRRPNALVLRAVVQARVIVTLAATTDLQDRLWRGVTDVVAVLNEHSGASAYPLHPPHGQRWGLGEAVDIPELTAVGDDTDALGLHGHANRIVQWEQTLYLSPDLSPLQTDE